MTSTARRYALFVVIPFAACFVAMSAAAYAEQIPPIPTAEADLLSESVWTVTTERAVFTAVPGALQYKEGPRLPMSLRSYDRDGWIVQEIIYGPDGKASSKSLFTRDEGSGLISSVTHYTGSNVLTGRESIEYSWSEDGSAVARETLFGANGLPREVRTIRYDKQGRETSRSVTDADGALVSTAMTSYDAQGRPLEIYVYDAGGNMVSNTVREYDRVRGIVVSETTSGPDGILVSTFESDSDRNWIVRTTYRMEFVPGGAGGAVRTPVETAYRFITTYG